MGTVIRPEVSKSNRYWISRHRYYELKHHCLQYPEWQEIVRNIPYLQSRLAANPNHTAEWQDATERLAERLDIYKSKISRVENLVKVAGGDLADWLLIGVTQGVSYVKLRDNYGIPCCKETYYEAYRKFFWLISQELHMLLCKQINSFSKGGFYET